VHLRDFEKKPAYAGWVEVWSESEKTREIVLRDVAVSDFEGDELFRTPRVYLARKADNIDIEFPYTQSVVADRRGSLWVVDPAAPGAEKTVKGGPKIVEIDLASNKVKRIFPMGADVAGPASYLNDIRIAPDGSSPIPVRPAAWLFSTSSPGRRGVC
jgi:hypothetical protein